MIATTSPLPERAGPAPARSPLIDEPAAEGFAPMLIDAQSGIGRATVDTVPAPMHAADWTGSDACLDGALTRAAEAPAAQGDDAPPIEADILPQQAIGHVMGHLSARTTVPGAQPVATPLVDLDANRPAPGAPATVIDEDADDDALSTASDMDGDDAALAILPAAIGPTAIGPAATLPVVPALSAGAERGIAGLRDVAAADTTTQPSDDAPIARGGDAAAPVGTAERPQLSPADVGGVAASGPGRAVEQDLAELLDTIVADADRATPTLAPTLTPTPVPAGQGVPAVGRTAVAPTATSIIDMAQGDAWLTQIAGDIARLKSSPDALHFRLHPANLGMLGVTLGQEGDRTQLILRVETNAAQRMLADSRHQLIDSAQRNGVELKDVQIELNMGAGGHADAQARRPYVAETARMLAQRLRTAASEGEAAFSARTVVADRATYRFA